MKISQFSLCLNCAFDCRFLVSRNLQTFWHLGFTCDLYLCLVGQIWKITLLLGKIAVFRYWVQNSGSLWYFHLIFHFLGVLGLRSWGEFDFHWGNFLRLILEGDRSRGWKSSLSAVNETKQSSSSQIWHHAHQFKIFPYSTNTF